MHREYETVSNSHFFVLELAKGGHPETASSVLQKPLWPNGLWWLRDGAHLLCFVVLGTLGSANVRMSANINMEQKAESQ